MNIQQKPAIQPLWLVIDENGYPIHCASYKEACHEHINDAINDFDIDGASKWRVIEASPKASKTQEGEAVALLSLKNTELQKRISVLEDLLSSAYNIANRNGENTHWERFAGQLHIHGINPVTPKTFKILPSDENYTTPSSMQLKLDKAREALELCIEALEGEGIYTKTVAKAQQALKEIQ